MTAPVGAIGSSPLAWALAETVNGLSKTEVIGRRCYLKTMLQGRDTNLQMGQLVYQPPPDIAHLINPPKQRWHFVQALPHLIWLRDTDQLVFARTGAALSGKRAAIDGVLLCCG